MYDSRSSHARKPQHEDTLRAYWVREDQRRDNIWVGRRGAGRHEFPAAEAIAEGLAEMQPEYVPERWDINRLHVEALREDDQRWNDIQDEAWAWLDEQERLDPGVQQELEAQARRDAEYDDAYGGYAYDGESWLPIFTMTEAREHFGPDFEHNGFQISHQGRPYARTGRKAPTMKDYERAEALMAAQRQRQQRLATLVPADEKAKVTRQLPVPHAERPEPTPYEKYAGVYNEALDPISPNFAMGSWGGE